MPVNLTLVWNRVCADLIKIPYDWSPYKKMGHAKTQTERRSCDTRARDQSDAVANQGMARLDGQYRKLRRAKEF